MRREDLGRAGGGGVGLEEGLSSVFFLREKPCSWACSWEACMGGCGCFIDEVHIIHFAL